MNEQLISEVEVGRNPGAVLQDLAEIQLSRTIEVLHPHRISEHPTAEVAKILLAKSGAFARIWA